MAVGVHVPLRFLRAVLSRGAQILKERLPVQSQQAPQLVLKPVYVHLPRTGRPISLRTKVSNRWYSTVVNSLEKAGFKNVAPRIKTPVRAGLARHTTSTPFASALRPKLVGGVLPRSAGGYSLGGPARYFSHTPAAPAQVIQQVSAAMRAFMVNGKGQLDQYRNATNSKIGVRAQLASTVMENAPGAYVDFYLSPTLTSLSPLNSKANSLESSGFIESLGADFGAMIGGLTAVYSDIQRLSQLGDLPITLAGPAGDILRVHFRGCDKEFVERLCNEFGILRGIVHEDERFAFSALPAHPEGSWREMMTDPPGSSTCSEDGFEDDIHLISGSESGRESDYFTGLEPGVVVRTPDASAFSQGSSAGVLEYEGPKGIHRFLEECDEYQLGRRD